MEEVIHDGVDLINISLGTGANDTDGFDMDLVAIGAFNAMAKGGHGTVLISDETADYTTVTYNYDGNHSKGATSQTMPRL
nr:unnamed protein product [Digitaria exilis]